MRTELTVRVIQAEDGFWVCSIDGFGTCLEENGQITDIQLHRFYSRSQHKAKAYALQTYADFLMSLGG